ncbi:MAG: Aspartate ammonia-lyase [Syntrophorhabdaceae bacterium]|nr:aspartate ammonia-lyase [Syntrophorhabdaceae bacterium]MBV6505546.1 Aspartate ammonia-lyase [Syntrophorhabdaceae bacterium]
MQYRIEYDSLGEKEVPAEVYYGIQTMRAIENFPITGIPISEFPVLIKAIASIKEAAAITNKELGLLDAKICDAIVKASRDVKSGLLNQYFAVDVIQGGAGTSTNVNANEVIANRALEYLGHKKGKYRYCHPNDHVNLSQSTNDVYPTTLKIAAIYSIEGLLASMGKLQDSFAIKGEEFKNVLKIGRTQLQDAVPMTLGQEFTAYSVTVAEDIERLKEATRLIHEINMGATAIGTGVNTVEGYVDLVRDNLIKITGLALVTSPNLVEATSDAGAFVQLSGVLKRIAVKISKICNDIRLLSSGPRAGLAEIQLPAMQPGSTIMPGKINPVIPEVVNQVCFQVIGNDMTITMAAEAGQLELNAFEPIIGFNILQSMELLMNAFDVLSKRCVVGIKANVERCNEFMERSVGLVTALVPIIGYETAASLAKEALVSDRTIRELIIDKGLLSKVELEKILDPRAMIHPGVSKTKNTKKIH